MANEYTKFEQRKRDHIELALMPVNQTIELNKLDNILLQHEALPDLNFADIDISSFRFGKMVKKPFLVSSMTAGHQESQNINKNLMHAASENSWAMGVGSQRRELTDKNACQEWHVLRKKYPDMCLFANLGIAQVITAKNNDIIRLTDALMANGLIIHCNPLQECIQPEGTPNFKGAWQAIENLVKNLDLPIIIKETGCGFSKPTMQRLFELGIAAVDVSGAGGTHWGRIETHRTEANLIRQRAGITFKNWGIDTVTSLCAANGLTNPGEVWGSGGIRNGLDAAKLIALGATTVGFAKSLLKAALESPEKVIADMQAIEYELKVAMFCTGSKFLPDLREKLCL
jgi:isopentenyl-diphosphate delta-isomerase